MTLSPFRPSVRVVAVAAFVGLLALLPASVADGATTREQGTVWCHVSGPQWRIGPDPNLLHGTGYLVRISIKSIDAKLSYSCAQAKAALKKLFLLYPHLSYPQAFGNDVRLRGGPAGFVCSRGITNPPMQDSRGICNRMVFGADGNIGGINLRWFSDAPHT